MKELVGTVLDNRFEIRKLLGAGGMAVVFLAHDLEEKRDVAIKVHDTSLDTQRNERFMREFMASLKLNHPNIIKLYRPGTLEGGGSYYAMELIDGPDLDQVMKEQKRLDEGTVMDVLEQMASAFQHMHELGIIHRDLKPSNILVAPGNRYVLTDFGLVKDLNRTQLTASGLVLGSPFYLSPEQALGDPIDHRSDIYQLGIIAFELLTGDVPFKGDNFTELYLAIKKEELPKVTEYVDDISPAWDSFLATCSAKEASRRFKNGQAMGRALEKLRGFRGRGELKESRIWKARLRPNKKKSTNVGSETGFDKKPFYVALAAFVLMLLFVFLGQSETYDVQNLKIEPAATSFTVSWQSTNPYVSRVGLGAPYFREVSGKASSTTSHTLTVRSLVEGKKYSFRIMFPSGEATEYTTVSTIVYSIEKLAAQRMEERLQLTWKPTVRGDDKVRLLYENGHEAALITQQYEGERKVLLPEDYRQAREITIDSTLPDGERRHIPVSALLTSLTAKLTKDMGAFQPAGLVQDLVASLMDGKENTQYEQILTSRLKDSAILPLYDEAAGLAPLVLSTEIVPLDLRAAFHERIQSLHCYQFFARQSGVNLSIPAATYLGQWERAVDKYNGTAKELVLKRRNNPLELTLEHNSVFEAHCHIPRAENLKACQLLLETKELLEPLALKIKLNSLPTIVLFDCRQGASQTLVQNLPVDAFRARNRLVLRLWSVYRPLREGRVSLRKISLRLIK